MLVLPASLTMNDARDTLRMLSQALEREPADAATVDASGLVEFDSSAVSVLLECQRRAQASGRGFVVRHAPPKLSQLARLYGVDALLTLEAAAA